MRRSAARRPLASSRSREQWHDVFSRGQWIAVVVIAILVGVMVAVGPWTQPLYQDLLAR